MISKEKIMKKFEFFKLIVFLINILIFVFTSIFTLVSVVNNWGNNLLSYLLLGCFILNVILYVIISSIKTKKDKSENTKDAVNMLNIVRKITSMGNVVLSLIITFTSYSNDAITLFSKILMSYMSFSIAIMYISSQVLIMFIRDKKNKLVNKFKRWKEEFNVKSIKSKD